MKTLNQNKLTATLILIIGFLSPVVSVLGQTVKVNINVNSSVGMEQVQPFEVVPEKKMQSGIEGLTERSRRVNATGAFTIKGKENSNVLVQLNSTDVLKNKENQSVPFNVSLAWHNNSAVDADKLKFNNNKSNVVEFNNGAKGKVENKFQEDDRLVYLYLKGTADVPSNSQSPLVGDIRLTVEY